MSRAKMWQFRRLLLCSFIARKLQFQISVNKGEKRQMASVWVCGGRLIFEYARTQRTRHTAFVSAIRHTFFYAFFYCFSFLYRLRFAFSALVFFALLLLFCFSSSFIYFVAVAVGIPRWIPWCATFVKMNSNWFIMSHRRHGGNGREKRDDGNVERISLRNDRAEVEWYWRDCDGLRRYTRNGTQTT